MRAEPIFIGCEPREAWPQMSARLLDAVRAGRTKMINGITLHWFGDVSAFDLQHIGEYMNTGIDEMPGVSERTEWVIDRVERDGVGMTIAFKPKT